MVVVIASAKLLEAAWRTGRPFSTRPPAGPLIAGTNGGVIRTSLRGKRLEEISRTVGNFILVSTHQ